MKTFHWTLKVFSYPKSGHSNAEFEDAWDIAPKKRNFGGSLRVAVADGATAASYSGEWAGALTSYFVRHEFRTPRGLKLCVATTAEAWWKKVSGLTLPWYAEEKARKGAFSSLLGLELLLSENTDNATGINTGEWLCIAVGDSCVFQIRDDKMLDKFPISDASEFGNTPALLSSNMPRNVGVWNKVVCRQGEWQDGDLFILATDALAMWFLTRVAEGQTPWIQLTSFRGEEDQVNVFQDWIDEMRSVGAIRNDDVTCLIIEIEAQ